MINNFNKKYSNCVIVSLLTLFLCFSCQSDLVETFEEFIPDTIVNIATPDAVIADPDYYKLTFHVLINSDPKVKKIIIRTYDEDLTDDDDKEIASLVIDRTINQSEVYLIEVDLPEGDNEYFVFLQDSEGNEGLAYDVFGSVPGDEYRADLVVRVGTSQAYSESEVLVTWENTIRETMIKETQLIYLDSNGVEQTLVIDNNIYTVVDPDTEIPEYVTSPVVTVVPNVVSEGPYFVKTIYYIGFYGNTIASLLEERTFPAL